MSNQNNGCVLVNKFASSDTDLSRDVRGYLQGKDNAGGAVCDALFRNLTSMSFLYKDVPVKSKNNGVEVGVIEFVIVTLNK